MGTLRNSIERGEGNLAGFLGELVYLEVEGGRWDNTFEYDVVRPDGTTVDVKTKRTKVAPKPFYDCSVADFNTSQNCDYYAFVRVSYDNSVGWYLGKLPRQKFYDVARFMRRGELDPSNNFTVKADCYNVAISELEL
jgi:hypothetical protein